MQMSNEEEGMKDLALRLVDAAQRGASDEVKAMYTPNAVVWHNTDAITMGIPENRAIYNRFSEKVPKREYTNIRITPFKGGYLQQHVLVGETATGEKFELHACIVVQVQNGKIVKNEEYFDSAPFKALGLTTWTSAK
jgi:ketosteroid isomerase-like protein